MSARVRRLQIPSRERASREALAGALPRDGVAVGPAEASDVGARAPPMSVWTQPGCTATWMSCPCAGSLASERTAMFSAAFDIR